MAKVLNSISVVIVSYNAPYFLQLCLESVTAAMKGIPGEIIVVDNDSSEDCVPLIRSKFPEVRLISNPQNVGFSRAANQGAEVAQGDCLLILNPDTVLPEDSLKKALEFLRNHPDTGAMGCRFIDGSGTFLPECKRNFPGMISALGKLVGLDWGYYADDLVEKVNGEVEVLTGAFLFLKREVFESMAGFDESFFMFGEDIDLSYRIRQSGLKNRYLGEITVVHFKGESSVKDTSYLKHFYGALEIFYRKHFRHHAPGRGLLRMLVRMAIALRSHSRSSVEDSHEILEKSAESVFYVGDRSDVFKALQKKYGDFLTNRVSSLNEVRDLSSDQVFLDSAQLSFQEIIKAVELWPPSVRKRIISRDGDFFIGSDDSRFQGESERLQP